MKKILVILFLPPFSSFCQNKNEIQDSVWNAFVTFSYSKTEQQKTSNSEKFSDVLQYALGFEKSFQFPFDSLAKYKVMIESPDKEVRIFTWNVAMDDGTHTFYGFIRAYNKKTKKHETYKLTDKSDEIKNSALAYLDNTKWYGAYYYQIVEKKFGKKKYYFLIGWDGNVRITNKRLIDVLTFNANGFPKFGENIFSDEKGKITKRFFLEYQAGRTVLLRYDPENDMIVFDHLSPPNPELEGQFQFYGPDFTFDGLRFKDGKWEYVKNVDVRNPKDKTDKLFNPPK